MYGIRPLITAFEEDIEENEFSVSVSDRDETIAKATGTITILIRVPDEEPRHREVSRQFLVKHCEYFFNGFCDPRSGVIEDMTDFDPKVVDLFLNIVEDWDDYKKNLKNMIKPENFRDINRIAVALDVGQLKETCDQWLMETINSKRSLEDDENKRFLVEESFFIARKAKFVDDDSISHLKYVEQLFKKLNKMDNTSFLKTFMVDYDRFNFDELDLLLKIGYGRKLFYEIINTEAESEKEINFRKTKFLLDKLGLRSLVDYDKDLLSDLISHLTRLRHLTLEDHQYLPKTLVNAQRPSKIMFYRIVFPKTSKYRFDGNWSPYVRLLLCYILASVAIGALVWSICSIVLMLLPDDFRYYIRYYINLYYFWVEIAVAVSVAVPIFLYCVMWSIFIFIIKLKGLHENVVLPL